MISIVTPVKGRTGYRVRNFIKTLRHQTIHNDKIEIIVSDLSDDATAAQNAQICKEEGAIHAKSNYKNHWNKPLAINLGIKKSSENSKYLMSADIDFVFKPNFVESVIRTLEQHPKSFVLCQAWISPEGSITDSTDILKEFDDILPLCTPWPRCGNGGIQCTARNWWFNVQGVDEDYFYWGGMDNDMANRAQRSGLKHRWITKETSMIHQWHEKLKGKVTGVAKRCNIANRIMFERRGSVKRNPDGWADEARVDAVANKLPVVTASKDSIKAYFKV